MPLLLGNYQNPLPRLSGLFSPASLSNSFCHHALPCLLCPGHPGLLSISWTASILIDCNELSSVLHTASFSHASDHRSNTTFFRHILPMSPKVLWALSSSQATDSSTVWPTTHNYLLCWVAFPLSASMPRMNGSSREVDTLPTLFRAQFPEPSTQKGSRLFVRPSCFRGRLDAADLPYRSLTPRGGHQIDTASPGPAPRTPDLGISSPALLVSCL